MKPIPYIVLGVVAFMTSAWLYDLPAEAPAPSGRVSPVIMACSEIFMATDTRFIAQPHNVYIPLPASKPATCEKPKAKNVCRRGEKIWYYNKEKKRRMYRIRENC